MGNEVLFYAPNIIGYIRLTLLLGSLVVYDKPLLFLSAYIVSVSLDAVDGILARRLNQVSAFGAWFDVLIDVISRGALWCFISKWAYFMVMIEWLTFVCTHSRGANWKIPDDEFPAVCKMVMANGFKTPIGSYAIAGIFMLPLWLYGMTTGFLYSFVGLTNLSQCVVLVVLICGRLLALCTEILYIWQHIKELLSQTPSVLKVQQKGLHTEE